MATHSSILAWRIPCMEEPGGLQATGRKELDTTERLNTSHRASEQPGLYSCGKVNQGNMQCFLFKSRIAHSFLYPFWI